MLACPARFERATYALEKVPVAPALNYLNRLQRKKGFINLF